MRWRQRIGWLVAPMGVECHRRGSSVVRRPVKILCSSRSRGTSLFEQIEGSLGLVSMRAAVDLFEWRGRIGSAASLGLPSLGWWRVVSWRVCETERGRPESIKTEAAKLESVLIKGIFWYRFYIRVPLSAVFRSGPKIFPKATCDRDTILNDPVFLNCPSRLQGSSTPVTPTSHLILSILRYSFWRPQKSRPIATLIQFVAIAT